MKKTTILLALLFAGAVLAVTQVIPVNKYRDEVNPGQVHTAQRSWDIFGDTATALTTGTTTPGVAARTSATFTASDANNITHRIDPQWNKVLLRLSTITDGDDTVLDVFLMDADPQDTTDHYNRWGTLTWVTGTQTGDISGEEWADTVAVSNNGNARSTFIAYSPTGNYIAEVELDVKGAYSIGISPTTVDNNGTLYIKGY